MVTNQPFESEISPEEMTFRTAMDAVEQGKLAEARELLTGLIKTNQARPEYWVWLSAAMETPKERLYCLQTALRLDPNNAEARRGLILMGALPPDESRPPFPMNHPRPWDSKALADEAPRPTGWKALIGNPLFRVAAILLVGVILIGGVVGGLTLSGAFRPQRTRRAITLTPTPTVFSTPRPGELRPLSELIAAEYTPTLVYALTPHGDVAADSYSGAMRAYGNKQWDLMSIMMEQVATAQPGSVDAVFFMGESRRLAGNYKDALTYYQRAIEINPNFAPSYLGRARANLALTPKKDILPDLDAAIAYDPNYWEAYLERGLYLLKKGETANAMLDLRRAKAMMPDSPLVQIALARAELALGNNERALEAAQQANQFDPEEIESYLVLGMAYRANGDVANALKNLEFYLKYSPDNAEAFTFLGAAYVSQGDYEKALTALDQAIRLDKNSAEAYTWRGEAQLALKNYEQSKADFRTAFRLNGNSFEAGLGIARAEQAMDDFGNAYVSLLAIEKLADTDAKKGRYWYYRAFSLRDQNFPDEAYKDWLAILALPEEAVSAEMRAEVEQLTRDYRSPTPPAISATPTVTASLTATQTRQPSRTPTVTNTRAPSATP
ncbi:MAG: hypothetical protein Fur0035_02400 [Anaerolineales bacterium]